MTKGLLYILLLFVNLFQIKLYPNGGTMDTKELQRGIDLGDLLFQMLQVFGHPAFPVSYGVLGYIDEQLGTIAIGQPLGGSLSDPTVSGIAYGKFGELIVASRERQTNRFAVTPFQDYVKSYGWMGGVLFDDLAAAISGLPQEVDRVIAATLVYAMLNDVSLHHVGYRHGSEDAMWDAAIAYARQNQTDILNRPADDHQRLYLPVDIVDGRAPNGVVYVEHQFFPGKVDAPEKIHFDLLTPNPVDLLIFLAGAFGQEPVLWPDGDTYDPVGEFKVVSASRGIEFSVMARDQFWPVELRS
ncbi:MAG: hypothetical protein H6773_04290 [Pseudomonadales bacterium]|nr:hypothetical protein [Pseudomonadales bacterium]